MLCLRLEETKALFKGWRGKLLPLGRGGGCFAALGNNGVLGNILYRYLLERRAECSPALATPGSESSHLAKDSPTSSSPEAALVGPT